MARALRPADGAACRGRGCRAAVEPATLATGPMVTAATADASAVRSAGLYCRSPVVSRARCLQAVIQATALQFVTSGSASSAPSRPLCCTVVAVSSGGPCCSASGPCPGERAGGTGCGKACAPLALRMRVVPVLPAVFRGGPR